MSPTDIRAIIACAQCESHERETDLLVGFTDTGIEIWCVACETEVAHLTPKEVRHFVEFVVPQKECGCVMCRTPSNRKGVA